MKKIEKKIGKVVLKLAFLAVLFLTASCSQDMADLEENQKGVQAKNSKAVLKTIAKGAKIHGTNGIYFGPDDNLYIASFFGQEVVVMDKESGKIIRRFGGAREPEDLVFPQGPDDLVFHPDGQSFYYTDITTGFVGRMALDGTPMGYQEVAPGTNPITFLEEDGKAPRLFVGLDFQGDGLYELDPELVDQPRAIVPDDGDPTTFPLGFLNAFDIGPDGRLYGPSFLFRQIISVDIDRGPTTNPYGDGTALVVNDDDWEYPVAAKFGPDGLLTVLDQNGEVSKVDIVTKTKTLFTTLQPGLDNLAFDSDGTLYVSNADFGWIVEILPNGKARTISKGGMIGPMGVAVLAGEKNNDDVFVGDLFRMYNFNGQTGNEKEVYKGYLVGEPGKLTMPFSVQADGENLLVTSWFSGLVQSWNPGDDTVIEQYQTFAPIDAVRVNGEIYISELALGGIVKASSPLTTIANLSVASGLATDGNTLWAADWATGDVWQIDFLGDTPQEPFIVASGLSKPEGLAFEKDGSLVVVDWGTSSLRRIDYYGTPGENVTIIAEGLELSAPWLAGPTSVPTWYFDGVAVGPSGDIYVTGGGANVLYRISPK